MWTKELQHKNRTDLENLENSYKNIPIYAASNLHEKCFEIFEKYVNKNGDKKETKVLILGAGGGAFDQRLIDAGYTNITAVEIFDELYRATNSNIISQDLNLNFSSILKKGEGKYDVIVAMEIIEHIENHFHFMREVKSLLADDGTVIISTPNVESNFSRFKYFLRGDLSYFSQVEIEETGHINPLFSKIFFKYLEVVKLKVVETSSNLSIYELKCYSDIKQKINVLLSQLFTVFMKNKDDKQISIFVIKNK